MSKRGTMIVPKCPECGAELDMLRAEIPVLYSICTEDGAFVINNENHFFAGNFEGSLTGEERVHCSVCGCVAIWNTFLQKREIKDGEISDGRKDKPIEVDSDGKACDVHNYYRCPDCKISWDNYWSCGCNDDCPHCNCEIEPAFFNSVDEERAGWSQMEDRVMKSTIDQLNAIWDSLKAESWGKNTPSPYCGVMMDHWAEAVKCELERREMPQVDQKEETIIVPDKNVPKSKITLSELSKFVSNAEKNLGDAEKSPKEPKRFEINADVMNYSVICNEERCPQSQECAQHTSAGEFREEDGMTPDLIVKGDKAFCTKLDTERYFGMLKRDGNEMVLEDRQEGDRK